jgi:hypothetical protein
VPLVRALLELYVRFHGARVACVVRAAVLPSTSGA